jgi:hypothetical protein
VDDARQVALELGEIDVTRLNRCERAACDLVFYDTACPTGSSRL